MEGIVTRNDKGFLIWKYKEPKGELAIVKKSAGIRKYRYVPVVFCPMNICLENISVTVLVKSVTFVANISIFVTIN